MPHGESAGGEGISRRRGAARVNIRGRRDDDIFFTLLKDIRDIGAILPLKN